MKKVKRSFVSSYLESKQFRNVLDVGSGGKSTWENSVNIFVDYFDFSRNYPGKRFIKHNLNSSNRLPFADKEIDFLICSHCIEHVNEPLIAFKEFSRIAKEGYIEFPTIIGDNINAVNGDGQPLGHKWWFDWDDNKNKLIMLYRQRILKSMPEDSDIKLEINKLTSITDILNFGFHWQDSIDCTFRAQSDMWI